MFMELGMKLDNLMTKGGRWHRKRFWYKIYAHFYINILIKNRVFDDDSFNYFMNTIFFNKQIWGWQYELFQKRYRGE